MQLMWAGDVAATHFTKHVHAMHYYYGSALQTTSLADGKRGRSHHGTTIARHTATNNMVVGRLAGGRRQESVSACSPG